MLIPGVRRVIKDQFSDFDLSLFVGILHCRCTDTGSTPWFQSETLNFRSSISMSQQCTAQMLTPGVRRIIKLRFSPFNAAKSLRYARCKNAWMLTPEVRHDPFLIYRRIRTQRSAYHGQDSDAGKKLFAVPVSRDRNCMGIVELKLHLLANPI